LLAGGLAVACLFFLAGPTPACPFCTLQGTTLTQDLEQASMVLFGRLTNAQLDPSSGDFSAGTTDLEIDAVIKDHAFRKDKKVIKLPRYLPPEDKKYKYLVFCDVFKEKLDPYRGVAIKADSDIARYLAGALKIKDQPLPTRLRYFFDYLGSDDLEISNDAYKEFGNADYKEFRLMAPDLPDKTVASWLDPKDEKSKKTQAFRYGLYSSMLAHCSKDPKAHASLLRSLVEDPEKRPASGLDGVLAGYVLLDRKEGWDFLRSVISNPKEEFLVRYSALKAVRFFVDLRPDVIARGPLIDAACTLIRQPDIADLAIEDLRKWKCWDRTDEVLGLQGTPGFKKLPIIRRAVLRFALSCPKEVAVQYVKEQRSKDPQGVADAEELLQLETGAK
jgi:hypothetical protein